MNATETPRRDPTLGWTRAALLAVTWLFLASASSASSSDAPQSTDAPRIRRFTFTYEVGAGPFEPGSGPIDIFLPIPVEDPQQRVISIDVESDFAGTIESEEKYGNRFWRAHIASAPAGLVSIKLEFQIERRFNGHEPPRSSRPLSTAEREALARYLDANERVVVGHPILDPILKEIRTNAGTHDRAAVARAIYDWIVENVEYKKVGKGWGNGDTFWACSERYGNCTDFHSLFISLARTEGIPARFEMGFPVPMDREAGKIDGYHCWVQFYLPGSGWFPIDASEASKHPEMRELLYGAQPTDRVHFSTGRDIRLGEAHRDRPLNYFIDPYVEVAGKRWGGPIARSLRYADRVESAEHFRAAETMAQTVSGGGVSTGGPIVRTGSSRPGNAAPLSSRSGEPAGRSASPDPAQN